MWHIHGMTVEASVESNLYGTVPPTNYLGVFSEHPPAVKKAVEFLEFKKADVAQATGVATALVRYDSRASEMLRQRLEEIATICELVADHFAGDIAKAALWFRVANPMLGGASPRDMIRLGRYKKLLSFVLSARQSEKHAEVARGK